MRPQSRLFQLFLLAAATWTSTYGRSTLGPIQEAIRTSLSLTDNQMALVQGLAMALPMSLGAIPLGLLADRLSRARMIVFFVTLALSSCVLSAFASNFALLFAARALAGLSSSGLLVCAYAIASDLFAVTERGRATMVVLGGEVLGAPVAFALGGTLLVGVGSHPSLRIPGWELADWRWALLWLAAVGLPILILLLLFLREPSRTGIVIANPPMRKAFAELWSYRAIVLPILFARGMIWIADGAVFVWGVPTFARRFHMPPDQIGALMGTVLLAGGLIGPLLGGPLADFCQRHGGPRRTMQALGAIALLSAPVALFALMPNATAAAILLAIFLTLGFAITTAGTTLAIVVIPGELRGFYLGITVTAGSLFFVGLAPLIVSTLSGALGGESMIGRALSLVCLGTSVLGAIIFAISARYFPSAQISPDQVFSNA